MTTRDLINKVLRGIRQFGLILTSSDSSTTDEYLLMILQFLNEAKEEIEEAGWSWQALRQTVTVTLAQGTTEYDITIAGAADVDTNDRTRLLYENVTYGGGGGSEGFFASTSSKPMVFDVTDAAEYRLTERTQEYIERMHFTDDDAQHTNVRDFCLYSDGDSIKMKVWPIPAATRTIKLRFYIPQAELAETDLTTVLSIPGRPVWTLALFKANQERGDELGVEGSVGHLAYLNAHGSAVAREQRPCDITVGLDR
jgi:hypothetical protein